MKKYIKQYKKVGFCTIRNFLPKALFKECMSYIKNYKEPKDETLASKNFTLFIFYKNIDKKNSPFMKILEVDKLIEFAKQLNISNLKYLYPRCYNKSKWYGPAQHYHQELFYNKKYGYGMNKNDYFLIFVALEKHNEDNGCLRLVPYSHTLGELEHKQFINKDLFEDSRIKTSIMNKCSNKYGIHSGNLNPGDCIIFHPLTIHGSSTNASQYNRKGFSAGIVNEKYIDNYDSKNAKKLTYVKVRKNFVINKLHKKLTELQNLKDY